MIVLIHFIYIKKYLAGFIKLSEERKLVLTINLSSI